MTTNLKRIAEAYTLFNRAMSGDLRAKAEVRESLTTSDFPVLLGQGYNRKLLAAYEAQDPVWEQYSTRVTVPDFRKQRLGALIGQGPGLPRVPEASEFPARDLDEREYDFAVQKHGERIPLTWEMIINDELGAFRNLDQVMAADARFTEGTVTADSLLLPNKSDLNTDFFAVVDVALTQDSLQDAIAHVSTKRTQSGQLLVRPNLRLVVTPQQEFLAKSLVGPSQIELTDGDTKRTITNPLAGSVEVVVEPNLLRNTNAKASTSWLLLPQPGQGRPAVVTGFLQGYEVPDLRVKNNQGVRPGGGSIGDTEGAFDDDTIEYRVRHVVGAATIDSTFTYASRGA